MRLIHAVKAAAAVGAIGMALVVAPQASATPIVAGHTITLPTPPAKPTIKPDIVPTATSDTCAAVLSHLKDYAARGVKQVACEKTVSTASSPVAPTEAQSVPAIGFPAACANNHWVVVRTEECNLSSVHIWTTWNTSTGEAKGKGKEPDQQGHPPLDDQQHDHRKRYVQLCRLDRRPRRPARDDHMEFRL